MVAAIFTETSRSGMGDGFSQWMTPAGLLIHKKAGFSVKAGSGGRGGHHCPRRRRSAEGLDQLTQWVGSAFPGRANPVRTSSHGGGR